MAGRARFENRTWTLVSVDGQWTFDGFDPVGDEAMGALSGKGRSWAHSVLVGLNEVTARGWIDSIDDALGVIGRARRLRSKLALTSSSDVAVLVVCSFDDDRNVRARVAEAGATPPDVLARLAGDEDRKVKRAALKNPGLVPADVDAGSLDRKSLMYVLANTQDEALVAGHLDDSRVTIRRALAENPCSPPEWVGRVVEGDDRQAALFAAQNPVLPAEAADRMLERWLAGGLDGEWGWVARMLVFSGHGSPDLLDRLSIEATRSRIEDTPMTVMMVVSAIGASEVALLSTRDRCFEWLSNR